MQFVINVAKITSSDYSAQLQFYLPSSFNILYHLSTTTSSCRLKQPSSWRLELTLTHNMVVQRA